MSTSVIYMVYKSDIYVDCKYLQDYQVGLELKMFQLDWTNQVLRLGKGVLS